MQQSVQKIIEWFQVHARTLDLLPDYARAVYQRWNDYLWGELAVAPVVIWWIFGNPPMWVTIPAFFWAFLISGYYVWRKENLKHSGSYFRCWIYEITVTANPTKPGNRVFIEIRITNIGPPTSLHGWQAVHKLPDGTKRVYLEGALVHLAESDFVQPMGIRGSNLCRDYRMFQTGETREGWIAFDVGAIQGAKTALEATALIGETASARFVEHLIVCTRYPACAVGLLIRRRSRLL
jgi:hypothetical protein